MGALPLRLQPSTSFDPSSPSILLPNSSVMNEPATTSASRNVWVDVQTPPSQASAIVSAEALQDLVASSVQSTMATTLQDVNQTIDGRVQAAILQWTQRQEIPPATSSAPGASVATGPGLSGLPNPSSIASVPLMSGGGTSIPFPTGLNPAALTSSLPHLTGSGSIPSITVTPAVQSLPMVGPCAVPIPAKLAQRIWRKEFVDMALLLHESLSQLAEDRVQSDPREETKGKKARHKVVNILQWVECFHNYISVVIVQQPSRVIRKSSHPPQDHQMHNTLHLLTTQAIAQPLVYARQRHLLAPTQQLHIATILQYVCLIPISTHANQKPIKQPFTLA